MAKQRIIRTVMWSDPFFIDLSAQEKLLFIYLITNERVNICGIYEISIKTIMLETDLSEEFIKDSLKRFEKCGKIVQKEKWILVLNFMKHQNVKSPKIVSAITRELSEMPEEIIRYIYGTDTVSHFTLPNGVTLPNFTSPNQVLPEEESMDGISSFLNSSEFEEFWEQFPKKTAKTIALRKWKEVVKDEEVVLAKFKEAFEWQKDDPSCFGTKPQYQPKAEDYILGERWNDKQPEKKKRNRRSM